MSGLLLSASCWRNSPGEKEVIDRQLDFGRQLLSKGQLQWLHTHDHSKSDPYQHCLKESLE